MLPCIMKLPGLTPGVSFVPKSQLRLILPPAKRKGFTNLAVIPAMEPGSSLFNKKTPFSCGGIHTPSLGLTPGVYCERNL